MQIGIASGKGGTGKTTVAVNLALANSAIGHLLDCDVEAPNCHLFLPAGAGDTRTVGIPVPQIDADRCQACGTCARFCQFKALAAFGTQPLVFPELCHGCGGCARLCPHGAIRLVPHPIGEVETRVIDLAGRPALTLVTGRLQVGHPMSPPLIRAVRQACQRSTITVIDSPPGTSCPVIAAIHGCDVVVLVTEPTPFGLHDLQLAVATVRRLRLPFGVVVNRAEPGETIVADYCHHDAIPLLAELPFDRRLAEAYSRGVPAVVAAPDQLAIYRALLTRIQSLAHTPHPITPADCLT